MENFFRVPKPVPKYPSTTQGSTRKYPSTTQQKTKTYVDKNVDFFTTIYVYENVRLQPPRKSASTTQKNIPKFSQKHVYNPTVFTSSNFCVHPNNRLFSTPMFFTSLQIITRLKPIETCNIFEHIIRRFTASLRDFL